MCKAVASGWLRIFVTGARTYAPRQHFARIRYRPPRVAGFAGIGEIQILGGQKSSLLAIFSVTPRRVFGRNR